MVPKKKKIKAIEMLSQGETQSHIAKVLHVSKSWVYLLNRELKNQYGTRINQKTQPIQTLKQIQPIPQPQPQPNQTVQEQPERNPFKLEPNYTDVSIGSRGGISTSNKSTKNGYRYVSKNLVYDYQEKRHFLYSILEDDWVPLNF